MRFSQRRGAQIRRTARRRLFESCRTRPRHAAACRRQTGRRAARRNGKCRDHRLDAGGIGSRAKNRLRATNTFCAACGARILNGSFCTHCPARCIVGAGSPRLWNTVSALGPEGERKLSWVVQTRQGGLRRFDRFGLHDRQGGAIARPRRDAFQGGGRHRVLRFSSGWETTEADWDALVAALGKIHEEMHHARAHAEV